MSYIATQRYTQALFDLCLTQQKVDSVYEDLKRIHLAISQSTHLKEFLNNPSIGSQQRFSTLEKLFKSNVTEFTFQFILFIAQKRRLNLISSICECFEQMYLPFKNILEVWISCRSELDAHQLTEIKTHLKTKFEKEIHPNIHVDSEMIGGIKIKIEDIVYDYSIRGQLEKFRKNFITGKRDNL